METNKNFYTEETDESVELVLEDLLDEAPQSKDMNLPKEEVLRIEGMATSRFSGVRGCGDADTHKRAATKALNEWAQRQIFEHRNLTYIRFNHLGGKAYWTNRTDYRGRRSCSGHVEIKCFIEFRKP